MGEDRLFIEVWLCSTPEATFDWFAPVVITIFIVVMVCWVGESFGMFTDFYPPSVVLLLMKQLPSVHSNH